MLSATFILSFFAIQNARGQYSATYLPSNAPPTTEEGQTGTNQCGAALNQTSMCQNAYSEFVVTVAYLVPKSLGLFTSIQ